MKNKKIIFWMLLLLTISVQPLQAAKPKTTAGLQPRGVTYKSVSKCTSKNYYKHIIYGFCGEEKYKENVIYKFDKKSGHLHISGRGTVGVLPPHIKVAVKTVSLGENIDAIGDFAFSYCKNIEEIVIQKQVKCIGAWAFHNCTSLKTVSISSGVKSVGRCAFLGDFQLSVVKIIHDDKVISKACIEREKQILILTLDEVSAEEMDLFKFKISSVISSSHIPVLFRTVTEDLIDL